MSNPSIVLLQSALNIVADARLQVDGVAGKRTRAVWASLSPSQRASVAKAMDSVGLRVPDLDGPTRTDRPEIINLIRTQARAQGVNPDLAVAIATIESGLDPTALSPTGAAGLFQLTNIAIRDAVQRSGAPTFSSESGKNIAIVKSDMKANVVYGIHHIKQVTKDLSHFLGHPIDPLSDDKDVWAKIYAGFNIGATAAATAIRANEGRDVSPHSRYVAEKAIAQQARSLQKGGLDSYLENVRDVLATV